MWLFSSVCVYWNDTDTADLCCTFAGIQPQKRWKSLCSSEPNSAKLQLRMKFSWCRLGRKRRGRKETLQMARIKTGKSIGKAVADRWGPNKHRVLLLIAEEEVCANELQWVDGGASSRPSLSCSEGSHLQSGTSIQSGKSKDGFSDLFSLMWKNLLSLTAGECGRDVCVSASDGFSE